MVVCEGHALRKISGHVVECTAGGCTEYYTERKGRVVACDGLGWVQEGARSYVSPRVESAIHRLLHKGDSQRVEEK